MLLKIITKAYVFMCVCVCEREREREREGEGEGEVRKVLEGDLVYSKSVLELVLFIIL